MIPQTLTGKAAYIIMLATAAAFLMVAVPASGTSDKNPAECTGLETSGHCVDKCPPTYHLQGYTDAGLAICSAPPTGCPYGDHVPLGADCDKLAPQSPAAAPEAELQTQESWGK